jgi:hypothetical protein
MERAYSFIELAHMHLVCVCVKEYCGMLHMMLNNAEENILIGECQIIMLSFLLTTDPKRGKILWDGFLHSVHKIQMEDNRPLRLLKDGLPSVPGIVQLLVCEIITF